MQVRANLGADVHARLSTPRAVTERHAAVAEIRPRIPHVGSFASGGDGCVICLRFADAEQRDGDPPGASLLAGPWSSALRMVGDRDL
jgi:hypothetical protein